MQLRKQQSKGQKLSCFRKYSSTPFFHNKAFQNSVAVAMYNLVGTEGNKQFTGESIVVDPYGNVLSKTDASQQLTWFETDLSCARTCRESKTIPDSDIRNYTSKKSTLLWWI